MSTTTTTHALKQPPRPRLPSMSEIELSLRERLPGLTIYSPADHWVPLNVFGLTHLWAVPDLDGAIEAHPVTGEPTVCNGETHIRGRYPLLNGRPQKDSSGKDIGGQDAPAIIKYLVGPDTYGQLGLVWLPKQSAEEDAKLREASKGVWLLYQQAKDDEIVSKRSEFKSNWLKNPAKVGVPVPPPTRAESAAMERVQLRKHNVEFRYNCPVTECPGYAENSWEKFATHMRLAHRQVNLDRRKFEMAGYEAATADPETAGKAEQKILRDTYRSLASDAQLDELAAQSAAIAASVKQEVEAESLSPEEALATEDAPLKQEEKPQPRSATRKR